MLHCPARPWLSQWAYGSMLFPGRIVLCTWWSHLTPVNLSVPERRKRLFFFFWSIPRLHCCSYWPSLLQTCICDQTVKIWNWNSDLLPVNWGKNKTKTKTRSGSDCIWLIMFSLPNICICQTFFWLRANSHLQRQWKHFRWCATSIIAHFADWENFQAVNVKVQISTQSLRHFLWKQAGGGGAGGADAYHFTSISTTKLWSSKGIHWDFTETKLGDFAMNSELFA